MCADRRNNPGRRQRRGDGRIMSRFAGTHLYASSFSPSPLEKIIATHQVIVRPQKPPSVVGHAAQRALDGLWRHHRQQKQCGGCLAQVPSGLTLVQAVSEHAARLSIAGERWWDESKDGSMVRLVRDCSLMSGGRVCDGQRDSYRRVVNPAAVSVRWDDVVALVSVKEADADSDTDNCPICLEPPSLPHMSSCGHTFCLPCLLQYLELGLEEQTQSTTYQAPSSSSTGASAAPRRSTYNRGRRLRKSKRCPLCMNKQVTMGSVRPVLQYAAPPRKLPARLQRRRKGRGAQHKDKDKDKGGGAQRKGKGRRQNQDKGGQDPAEDPIPFSLVVRPKFSKGSTPLRHQLSGDKDEPCRVIGWPHPLGTSMYTGQRLRLQRVRVSGAPAVALDVPLARDHPAHQAIWSPAGSLRDIYETLVAECRKRARQHLTDVDLLRTQWAVEQREEQRRRPRAPAQDQTPVRPRRRRGWEASSQSTTDQEQDLPSLQDVSQTSFPTLGGGSHHQQQPQQQPPPQQPPQQPQQQTQTGSEDQPRDPRAESAWTRRPSPRSPQSGPVTPPTVDFRPSESQQVALSNELLVSQFWASAVRFLEETFREVSQQRRSIMEEWETLVETRQDDTVEDNTNTTATTTITATTTTTTDTTSASDSTPHTSSMLSSDAPSFFPGGGNTRRAGDPSKPSAGCPACLQNHEHHIFYQADDGSNLYLDSLNFRMLAHGSTGKGDQITLRKLPTHCYGLLQWRDGFTVSEFTHKRMRYLAHLPYGTAAAFAFVKIVSPTLSKECMSAFRSDVAGALRSIRHFEQQRKRDQQRAQHRYQKRIEAEAWAEQQQQRDPQADLYDTLETARTYFPDADALDDRNLMNFPALPSSPALAPSAPPRTGTGESKWTSVATHGTLRASNFDAPLPYSAPSSRPVQDDHTSVPAPAPAVRIVGKGRKGKKKKKRVLIFDRDF